MNKATAAALALVLATGAAPCRADDPAAAPSPAAAPAASPATAPAAAPAAKPATAVDSDGVTVPEGYVLQVLGATDGRIARPKDWFYANRATPGGWVWTFSAEDPGKGAGFETGLTLQMFVGVEENTRQPREAFARKFIEQKRQSAQVLRQCPVEEFPEFRRQCIEVLEDLHSGTGAKRFHILYSMMWLKNMDVVALSTFGAPEDKWDAVAPVTQVMSEFVLIGQSPGNAN
jgi:hypothetical protein